MNIIKRIEKLEEAIGARRVVGHWLNEGENAQEVRGEMLANGEIDESDFVQFVRWRTREEEEAAIKKAALCQDAAIGSFIIGRPGLCDEQESKDTRS